MIERAQRLTAQNDLDQTTRGPGKVIASDSSGDGHVYVSLGDGSGGLGNYTHHQALPLSAWTVDHNLDRRPGVHLTDSAGNVVLANIEHVSNNRVVITFSAALTGYAYFV